MNMERPTCSRATRSFGRRSTTRSDRRAYVAQAGPYAGQPVDAPVQPGRAGLEERQPVSARSGPAEGAGACGRPFQRRQDQVYYRSSGTTNPAQAADRPAGPDQPRLRAGEHHDEGLLGRRHLRPMGPRGTTANRLSRWAGAPTIRTRTTGSTRFTAGHRPRTTSNYSYMDLPKWNSKMEAAAKLVGPKRFKVYGAARPRPHEEARSDGRRQRTYNNRYLFSDRVDPKSLVYQGDLPGLEHPGARAEVGSAHAPGRRRRQHADGPRALRRRPADRAAAARHRGEPDR